ncbi:hemerythrin family protein [Fundidesulfovibrio butyratiphilus]
MPFLQWSDDLSIGIPEIDAQHQSLVEMLNSLHDAAENGDASAYPATVKKMKEYAIMHFSTEERHMKRHKYPDLFDHMAEHAFFVSKVKDFTASTAEEIQMLPAVLDFLKQWLAGHISGVDVKMGHFLRDKMGA